MVHDIKCPIVAPSLAFGNERVCQCKLIEVVRADERKQAGARVAERPYWEDEWPENLVMNRFSAIDAAEGGDGE